MSYSRWILAPLLLAVLAVACPVYAGEGVPFVGIDLGVAEPTNSNYRAHVQTGGSGSPYAGYMFNDYLGVQGDLQFTAQSPDNDNRRQLPNGGCDLVHHTGCPSNENQTTTVMGALAGPRIELPLKNLDIPTAKLIVPYLIAEGGVFTALSGSLNHTAPGFTVGGGVDYNVTDNFSVGLFGRWNRAYMAPVPHNLVLQDGEQGPADAQWATAGIGLKYAFQKPAPAPPPPPPPPPPRAAAPPVKKKIVLRAVHFDFDKSNIRADAVPILDEAVRILKEENIMAVISEGHTDSIGSVPYNLKLSQRRAAAVKKYLVDHGIPASHIKTEGFGKSRPVATNDTADGRQQNRRVELKID